MKKESIKQWIHTIITLVLFNIVVFMSVNNNNHIAPKVVYWITGAFTTGVFMNMVDEFKLFKNKGDDN